MQIYAIPLSLIVLIAGLLIYAFSNNPENSKPGEIGKIMFAAGTLAFLLIVSKV